MAKYQVTLVVDVDDVNSPNQALRKAVETVQKPKTRINSCTILNKKTGLKNMSTILYFKRD